MKVSLRIDNKKKQGKGYYFLDIYTDSENRKRKKIGIYKFLNPSNSQEREHNKRSKNQANAICNKTQNELFYSSNNITKTYKASENFFNYWEKFVKSKSISKKSIDSYHAAKKKLILYKGKDLIIGQIDYSYCNNFVNFLKKERKSNGDPLSSATINSYYKKLNEVLKELVNEEIISKNPCKNIKSPKVIHQKREFLTNEEIKLLINIDCKSNAVKTFYLISCFTGLRHSDVMNLKWKNIIIEKENLMSQLYINYTIQKTNTPAKIPVHNDIKHIISERKGDEDEIVPGLKYSAHNNRILKEWCLLAGIKKTITPHTARHTFATRYLSQTNDLYGLQNLIGHSELKTTQVYMHLVDDKLKNNVNSLKSLID